MNKNMLLTKICFAFNIDIDNNKRLCHTCCTDYSSETRDARTGKREMRLSF